MSRAFKGLAEEDLFCDGSGKMGMLPEVTEFHCNGMDVGIMQRKHNVLFDRLTQLQILRLPAGRFISVFLLSWAICLIGIRI